MRRILLCLVFGSFFAAPLGAQSPNGTISGMVQDPSGAVIAGAEITIVNDATRLQYSTQTNQEGIYVVPNLPPGPYRIQVAKIGFKTLIKPDIVLNVQDALAINFTLPLGAASITVTVKGGAPLVNSESASVSTVIDRDFVESLPLNGRSFNTLLQLTPGVVIASANPLGASSPGQFSISGQRTDANNFSVDGVSANFGVTTTAGEAGTGGAQALSALGGTSSLVSVDDLQEFRIETSSFAPEFGRAPGGQVILTTRSGTNELHGDIFDYFRNTAMDANDWFANQSGEPRAPEHHNDFGGSVGGPIIKDRTFYFLSYEGARLLLPQSSVTTVPSESARSSAPASLAPYLDAYPVPNGPVSPGGFTAKFTGTYSNTATLNAMSLRIDHTINKRFSLFGRLDIAPSEIAGRPKGQVLSEVNSTPVNTQTYTVGMNMMLTNQIANTLVGNYSTQSANFIEALDTFGGAVPLNPSLLLGSLPPSDSVGAFLTFDTGGYATGPQSQNRTRQLNFVDDLSITDGRHQLKFGEDYRAIFLESRPTKTLVEPISTSVQDFLTTGTASLLVEGNLPADILAQSFSLYGQDTWNVTPRLVMTYGLRWELAPAPSARGTTDLVSWTNVNDPARIALAPRGTPVWSTSYGNFAPRIGVAYRLTPKGDLVVRSGWGIYYDLGTGSVSDLAIDFPNNASNFVSSVSLPITNVTPYLPSFSTQPPISSFVKAFSPNLELPRSYQWNLAFEKSFGRQAALSTTYVGQLGRSLLRETSQFQPNPNFQNDFVLTTNGAQSSYHALQVQFRTPLSGRFQTLLNYTWSHSIDNASNDVVAGISNTVISGSNDRSSSDWDIRQSFSGAITLEIPKTFKSGFLSPMTENWSLDSVVIARSGFPFNGIVFSTSPDPGGFATSRPDLVPGQPLWIPDVLAPGGKSLNSSAFAIPSSIRQGTEGRNDIPGFGLTQIDLSIARKFPLKDSLNLEFRADAFNLFNHPNFTNPLAIVEVGTAYMESTQMLNQGLGGLNPLFQEGGPRSLQLSLKLAF